MFCPQRIRDPLHNLIEFQPNEFENALWNVIQTRPFQRLRRIKQLGFSDQVYPGATHSRFSHSVGVFHTARQLMGVIERKTSGLSDTKEKRALAAALLHDVGHGPFSHAFEDVGKRLKIDLASHEKVGDYLIKESEIKDVLNHALGSGFASDASNIIGRKAPSNIYDAVVSSQFDADRLDYMRRDRLMTGTQHGVIDFEWLLANLEIGKVQTGVDDAAVGSTETFVLGPKAIYAAETYVLGLFQLYPTVYFHKATRGAEKIFSELLCRTIKLIMDGSVVQTGLSSSHPIAQFALNPNSIECVLALDDTIMWGALAEMSSAKDVILSSLAKRLRDRNLYKSLNVREHILQCVESGTPTEKTALVDKISLRVRDKVRTWLLENPADLPSVLMDEVERRPYNLLEDGKGPLNQILIRHPSDGLVDLGERSDVVKSIQSFKVLRFYFPKDDEVTRKFLENVIKEEAQNVCKKTV